MGLQPPGSLDFLAGLLTGMAILVVMTAPILAKGLEAHHRIPPSRRGRRRIILAYDGLAAGELCIAGALMMLGTPLTGTPVQRILVIAGFALMGMSTIALGFATGNRQRAPLAGPENAPGGSSEANGPPAT